MLEGRPLYDTLADQRLYVAPDSAWPLLRRSAGKRFNTLVTGAGGTGKTSLLRHLAYDLRESGTLPPPVFVDATGAESPLTMIELVSAAVERRPDRGWDPPAVAYRVGASARLVSQIRELGDLEPRLFLVDASSAGTSVYELFGRMRDELWQLPHRWVVAVDDRDQPEVLRPPADAFFDVVVTLLGLDHRELAHMLRLREAGLNEESREAIAAASEGNPRRALNAARQALVTSSDPLTIFENGARLETEVSNLGRPYSMLFHELQALGSASASDPDLLARLGWTRERATQVLGDLEREGFVIASPERQPRGRPRKVYRPVERIP